VNVDHGDRVLGDVLQDDRNVVGQCRYGVEDGRQFIFSNLPSPFRPRLTHSSRKVSHPDAVG